MKTVISMCAIVALVTGCTCTPVIKTEVVTVTKPIPFIPPPPVVPKIDYEVDKLTPDASPGKVGQAYVHDMTYLRATIEVYEAILEQYSTSSAEFVQIEKKIQDLYKELESRVPPDPKTYVPPVDLKR